MNLPICKQCGSHSFTTKDNKLICDYCSTIYPVADLNPAKNNTTIELSNDIKKLLEKCRNDPANAKRYASLVLDIDPSNSEVIKYLR